VQQQPGRAVAPPVPVAVGAPGPPVAVPIHPPWVARPRPTRRPGRRAWPGEVRQPVAGCCRKSRTAAM
jgi:hypothetical protein